MSYKLPWSYGWLGGNDSIGASGYNYGYPAYTGGGTEPNVKAQWLFEEASGNAVDEVSSITLTPSTTGSGTIVYSQTVSGAFSNLSPGIRTQASGGNIAALQILTAVASLDVGATDHVVIEFWRKPGTITGAQYMFSGNADGSSIDYGFLCYMNGATSFNLDTRSDDEVEVARSFTVPNYSNSSDPVYYKIVWNRTAQTLELFTLGSGDTSPVSRGSGTMALLAGKVITNNGWRVNGQFNAGSAVGDGTWYEFRVSIGTDVLSNGSV